MGNDYFQAGETAGDFVEELGLSILQKGRGRQGHALQEINGHGQFLGQFAKAHNTGITRMQPLTGGAEGQADKAFVLTEAGQIITTIFIGRIDAGKTHEFLGMGGDIVTDETIGYFDVEVSADKTQDKNGAGRNGAFQMEIGLSGFRKGLSQTGEINSPTQFGAAGPNMAVTINSHKFNSVRQIRTARAVRRPI